MTISSKLVLPGVVAFAAVTGLALGSTINSLGASADTSGTSTSSKAGSSSSTQPDPTKGGHVGTNGTKEEVLTGDTADKVKAAAEKAVPGATVIRVENDAEGATYEAHMKKSDGSLVTVKFDANFTVTSTEDGMGAGGPGPQAKQN
jgi:hypothetical protein